MSAKQDDLDPDELPEVFELPYVHSNQYRTVVADGAWVTAHASSQMMSIVLYSDEHVVTSQTATIRQEAGPD